MEWASKNDSRFKDVMVVVNFLSAAPEESDYILITKSAAPAAELLRGCSLPFLQKACADRDQINRAIDVLTQLRDELDMMKREGALEESKPKVVTLH